MSYPRSGRNRRRRLREHPVARATIAILASLGGNALLVWLLASAGAFDRPREPATMRPVTLAPLSAQSWAANRAIRQPGAERPRTAAPQRAPDAQPPKRLSGEIVEAPPAPGAKAEPPPEARYLSDRDQRVEKETVSKYAGNYQALAAKPQAGSPGRQASGAGGAPPAPPAAPAQKATPPTPPRPEQRAPTQAWEIEHPTKEDRRLALAPRAEQGRAREESQDAIAKREAEARPQEPRPQQPSRAQPEAQQPSAARPPSPQLEGLARSPGPDKPDLSIGPETKARIAAGPGMAGFRQAEEGEFTALNMRDGGEVARYYISAGRKIEPDWQRRVRRTVAERDPELRMFFYKERSVTVAATLDASGNVREVSVLRSSNVEFYDEVAVASIRQAQPFQPPPPSMFSDGQVRLAFTFTLYPPDRRSFVLGQPLP